MRLLSVLALLVLSTPADAHRLDDWGAGAKSVALDDVVEVPLQLGPCGDLRPHVTVSVGEESYLFLLEAASSKIAASKSLIEAAGGEVKLKNRDFWKSFTRSDDHEKFRVGGKMKVAHLDEISVGDMVLSDVSVISRNVNTRPGVLPSCPATVDGVLGLESLDAAVAILPSEGVVRFAPSDRGSELVSALGGTSIATQSVDSIEFKYGVKAYDTSYRQMFEVTYGDNESPTYTVFSTERTRSAVQSGVAGVTTVAVADTDRAQVKANVAGLGEHVVWADITDMREALPKDWAATRPLAYLGHRFLRDYDIVFDPAGNQIALKAASAQKRADSLDDAIARATSDLEAAPDEEAASDEEVDEAAQAKERAGKLSGLASMLLEKGDLETAIQHLEEAAALQPDVCGSWVDASEGYAIATRFSAAAEAAEKAQAMYTAWNALSAEERADIEALEGDEAEAAAVSPQSSSCHVVYGLTASSKLAAGDTAGAMALYPEHLDLDHKLPAFVGVAALSAGDAAVAQSALRQALRLGASASDGTVLANTRLALSHATDTDQAIALWERDARRLANDPLSVAMYMDFVKTAGGDVNATLTALAGETVFPAAVHAVLGRTEESHRATALELYADEIAYGGSVGPLMARKAWAQWLGGDAEGAKTTADAALSAHPSLPYAWLVLSHVEAAAGNTEMAEAHAAKARGLAAGHIGFHLWIGHFITG